MDDVAITSAVKRLRKLHENAEAEDFFNHFTHVLKLPLSRGTSKDRLASFDEKIFEVVCQFATSFLRDSDSEIEKPDKSEYSNVFITW